jgi:hypothetical protein
MAQFPPGAPPEPVERALCPFRSALFRRFPEPAMLPAATLPPFAARDPGLLQARLAVVAALLADSAPHARRGAAPAPAPGGA